MMASKQSEAVGEVACTMCTLMNNKNRQECELCGSRLPIQEGSNLGHGERSSPMEVLGESTDHSRTATLPNAQRIDGNDAMDYVYCPYCGVKNAACRSNCINCSLALRTAVDQLMTDLSKSTNNFFRDVGVNLDVVCPGCGILSEVPPHSVVKCFSCGAYYKTSTIGDSATFHLNELGKSVSRGISSLFSAGSTSESERSSDVTTYSAPMGVLLQPSKSQWRTSSSDSSNKERYESKHEQGKSFHDESSSNSQCNAATVAHRSVDVGTQVEPNSTERAIQANDTIGTVVKVEGDVVQL